MTELAASDLHLSRLRPVTREDGCTLYQYRDRPPTAEWLPEGADPDPSRYRVLYAADWPDEVRASVERPGRHAAHEEVAGA